MTTITTTYAAPFGAITTYRVIHAIETAINSLITWNAQRKTFKMLNALSTQNLEDIGLTRADLNNSKLM
jgi:uncharacterized protein YjiS (DUF1127 family)